MSRKRAPVRISKKGDQWWNAYCRDCWWFKSYNDHATAIHAATQHVNHWIRKEKAAKKNRPRSHVRVTLSRTVNTWIATCHRCIWGRTTLTWKEAIEIALYHRRMTCGATFK